MHDVPGMDERDSLADLPREADASFLRQHEVVADSSLEQFSAVYTALVPPRRTRHTQHSLNHRAP